MVARKWIVGRPDNTSDNGMMNSRNMSVTLSVVRSGWDGMSFLAHARAGLAYRNTDANHTTPLIILLAQRTMASGSDRFAGYVEFASDDYGETWTGPIDRSDTLGPREDDAGRCWLASGLTPAWHAGSGRLLAVGNTVRYVDDRVMSGIRPMETSYAVYDADAAGWSRWSTVEMPDRERYRNSGVSGGQRVDLPNGEILQPIHFRPPEAVVHLHTGAPDAWNHHIDAHVAVMRLAFDGETLSCVEVGPSVTVSGGRGLLEPSLCLHRDTWLLTMRNNDRGYVSVSDDGRRFTPPKPWRWDDGSEVPTYNTQQHWLKLDGELYLVYTRRGAANDHVFRHRAPLFAALVDTDGPALIRDSEFVVVPERGARLGNFGVTDVPEGPAGKPEAWVTVGEWMQRPAASVSAVESGTGTGTETDGWDQLGADNSLFLARFRPGSSGGV